MLKVARSLGYRRPAVSVIVYGDSTPDVLRQLDRARRQSLPEIEIVVLAGAGQMAALGPLADEDFRVRVVPAPLGDWAGVRAEGARAAGADWMLFADHAALLRETACESLVGAAGAQATSLVVGALVDGTPPGPAVDATSLAETPEPARSPLLARMLVARRAWAQAAASDAGDLAGQVVGTELLCGGFATAGRATLQDPGADPVTLFTRVTRALRDPLPGLAARIHEDTTMLDRLALLPEARAARAAGALARGLPAHLTAAERADGQLWADLRSHAGVLVEAAGDQLGTVPVEDRVSALLAASGARDALERFVAARRHAAADLPTRLLDGRVLAVLPETDTVPQRALELAPVESALRARVQRCRVEDRQLVIELFAAIRHVSDEGARPTAAVTLVGPDRRVPLAVAVATDPAVTRWMGERAQRHHDGAIRASTSLDAVPEGPYRIEVLLELAGTSRTGWVTEREPHGSAARLREEDGVVLVDVLPQPHGRPQEGAIEAATVHGDRLLVDARGALGDLVLLGPGCRLSPIGQEDGRQVFDLRADPWGKGAAPAPTGTYRLVAAGDGSAVPVGEVLLARLPEQVDAVHHRVGLWRGPGNGLLVRLDPPLGDDEAGSWAQARLQRSYLEVVEPVDPELVYFQSFTGQWPNDHPVQLQQELHRRRPGTRMRWLVADSAAAVPAGADPVLLRSREWYDVLARAGHLVTNIDLERWFTRRPGQQVLQTYHGYPSKAMGIGQWRARGMTGSQVRQELERTSGTWTALLTPQPDADELYRREYAYDGVVLPLGYPRDDALVGPGTADVREETRRRLGITAQQTVVLYAPTWRDDLASNFRIASAVHHFDAEAAARTLGPDHVVLLRGHRFHTPRVEQAPGVVDVTTYPDVNELILASDAAVLDYSSLRFDYALTGRPMVFVVPDLADYTSSTRGFLHDFAESAPGPLVATHADAVELLVDVPALEHTWGEQIARFNQRFNRNQDGHAAERVVAAFFSDLLDDS